MKIVSIIGARPQFIKSQPMSIAMKNAGIAEVLIHTGQHFDHAMSQIFFDEMRLQTPQYMLDIHSLSHGAMTGRMLEKIEEILLHEKPDWTLVYGDTNSTLAGALASSKLHIPLVHVEAGIRSYDMRMPEEINRTLTDKISTLLLIPNENARKNLMREGFGELNANIVEIGDVMLDSALYFKQFAKRPNHGNLPEDFILCTFHRQENSDDSSKLKQFFEILDEASELASIILPLHPRTKARANNLGIAPKSNNVHIIEPVGYLEMLWLLEHSQAVMSDSGGVQKEAHFFGKSCLVLRENTEWIELLEHGNHLVGLDKRRIVETLKKVLGKDVESLLHLYGEGKAAYRAIKAIEHE
ncbi:MAG: non-hydrolyzing UDP-N-acetylglucosamine 2-epimerase [Wolinella sp.]